MAELDTLVEDVYRLFDPSIEHTVDEDNIEAFGETVKEIMRTRLRARVDRGNGLRFSALGRPNRQVWYDAHPVEGGKEEMLAKTYVKFAYGDLIEAFLLFLVKEAGHSVEKEQAEVEVDGVKGHIDAIIDGVVVDVKSASPFGYKKFANRTITEDDPFGYVHQLAGYASVLTPGRDAAWLAMDKVSGDICISPLSATVIKYHQPGQRIAELKSVIAQDEPPPLCYEPVADGKSGNMKLPTGCSYCAHKFRCHPGVRTFIYSTGPRFLTSVVKVPDVPEIDGSLITDA